MTAQDKNIKDVTINDIEDTVEEKFDDAKEAVVDAAHTVDGLSVNKKLAIAAATAFVASIVVQRVIGHFRKPVVIEGDVIVEVVDDEA